MSPDVHGIDIQSTLDILFPSDMSNLAQPTSALLKFQIGPVQDFIAAARSTRDLWSGSYLLSWLVAAGIRKLKEVGGELIFPSYETQPLLNSPLNPDWDGILVPNNRNSAPPPSPSSR